MIIEMREAAYEKAFGLLDEAKELDKQKKMIMCELEDTIHECYEASKDDASEYEEDPEDIYDEEPEMELNLRRGRNYLRNMRKGMRRGMRYDDESEDDTKHGYRMKNMRRRGRMGRFI